MNYIDLAWAINVAKTLARDRVLADPSDDAVILAVLDIIADGQEVTVSQHEWKRIIKAYDDTVWEVMNR